MRDHSTDPQRLFAIRQETLRLSAAPAYLVRVRLTDPSQRLWSRSQHLVITPIPNQFTVLFQ